jgi:phage baseplate assembly protein gpV
MLDDLLSENVHEASAPRIAGVSPAIVVSNLDLTGQGRVQVRFPWLADVEPWARVCAPVAGGGAGVWAIPQDGDEVLVAFANGDIAHPYVLGGVWSMTSRPPAILPTDAITKMVVKSPLGHTITIDDFEQSITLESLIGHKVEIGATSITISIAGGAASIELDVSGALKLSALQSVEISAPMVTVTGDASAKVSSSGSVELSGGASCKIAAAVVAIN